MLMQFSTTQYMPFNQQTIVFSNHKSVHFFRFLILCFVFLLSNFVLKAQMETGIEQWRDHYSNREGNIVAEAGQKIYCATQRSLFFYNKADGSIDRLSNANGLSDIGISAMNYHESSKTLVVAYSNANIDLIRNNQILNISDIKRSTFITGSKRINHIIFQGQFAYLSCSFGVVVLDLEKLEIRSTFYPGELTFMDVNQSAIRNDSLFITSNTGVWVSSLNNPSIVFFQGWQRLTQFTATNHSHIINRNNEIFVNKKSTIANGDTVYRLQANAKSVVKNNITLVALSQNSNKLVLVATPLVTLIDLNTNTEEYIFTFFTNLDPQIRDVISERNDPQQYWIADERLGLVSFKNFDVKLYKPSGPFSNDAFYMTQNRDMVWVAAGNYDASYTESFNRNGLFRFKDNQWSSIVEADFNAFIPFTDVVNAAIDPKNPEHGYLASWGRGLAEINNNEIVQIFNQNNSSLSTINNGGTVRCGGVTFDQEGFVWVTNSSNSTPVSCRKPDGSWKSFTFSSATNNRLCTQILCDSSGQKWVLMPGTGILTFKNEGDEITEFKLLNDQVGSGRLNNNTPLCIAEDLDGQIWVGTSKGVCVFYNPSAVFSNNLSASARDAQKIIIKTTGFNQFLLESEEVTCILVDGANRKWFGTKSGGIFLVSDDGTEQIYNFNMLNSPLPSNNILSLGMNQKTGELLVGTERGIVGFRSNATLADNVFGKVYVFPNPVKENYNGPVSITGLARDAEIRITDVAGNLVYRTKAEGGQATWNGRKTDGNRPATGVYLVFCSNEDGSETFVTKFVYIN